MVGRFARWTGQISTGGGTDALRPPAGLALDGSRGRGPAVRCLFTVFALHLAGRRTEALQLLGALAAGLRDQGEDRAKGPTSSCRSTVGRRRADAILSGSMLRLRASVASRHAYTNPAMMELLVEARRRAGVLAPAQFAWLKLVDRHLWYALHSLGYETDGFGRYLHPNPRVEAIGARESLGRRTRRRRAGHRAEPQPRC